MFFCNVFRSGKKVVDVAVGSTHCLALTDDGEVHSWGSNDKLQHFDTLFSNKKQPKALPGLNSKHIVGISCGPGQVMHKWHSFFFFLIYILIVMDLNRCLGILFFAELRLVLLLRVVSWAACSLCGGCLPHDI